MYYLNCDNNIIYNRTVNFECCPTSNIYVWGVYLLEQM